MVEKPFREGRTAHMSQRRQALDRIGGGWIFEDGEDSAGKLRFLQSRQHRRGVVVAQQLATQQHNETLLHQEFRHCLRAEARRRHFGHHGFEGSVQRAIRRETLDHGSLEQFEKAQGSLVAGRNLTAHHERVGAAVARREGDQPVAMQHATVFARELPPTALPASPIACARRAGTTRMLCGANGCQGPSWTRRLPVPRRT